MSANTLVKRDDFLPSFIDDFFKPWDGWFNTRLPRKLTVPAVNITEDKDAYSISVAAPGLKKTDFSIDVNGPVLTIGAESEKNKEETGDDSYTRREYNYSSFSRSFTLPDDVDENKIMATYDGGVLRLSVPKKQGVPQVTGKKIAVN